MTHDESSSPLLSHFGRAVFWILSDIVLIWTFVDIIGHESGQQTILGRYSVSYAFILAVYGGIVCSIVIASFVAVFRWEFLDKKITEYLNRHALRGWLIWIIVSGSLIFILLFSFVFGTQNIFPVVLDVIPMMTFFLVVIGFLLYRLTQIADEESQAVPGEQVGSQPVIVGYLSTFFDILNERLWVSFLIIVCITMLLYGPGIFSPEKLIGAGPDLHSVNYPLEQYNLQALEAGYLPHWNPYFFSGMPGLAHPQTMLFYPPQALLRELFPYNTVIALNLALHVFIAGIGMFFLIKKFRLPNWIALTCAISFMLSGEFSARVSAGHLWLIYAYAWLPGLWLLFINALEKDSPVYLALSALVLSFVILTGHPSHPGYIVILLGLYWLYAIITSWDDEHNIKKIFILAGKFGIILALALGLSAIQLFPSVIFAGSSSLSGGYDFSQLAIGSAWPEDLRQIFLPDAYPQRNNAIWETIPYIGVLPILAAPFGLQHKEHKRLAKHLAGVAVFMIALSLGDSIRIIGVFYALVPPFRVIRAPVRAASLWAPAVIVLAGFGLDVIRQRYVQQKTLFTYVNIYEFSIFTVGGVFVGYLIHHGLGLGGFISSPIVHAVVYSFFIGGMFICILLRIGSEFFSALASFKQYWFMAVSFLVSAFYGLFVLPELVSNVELNQFILGFSLLAVFLAGYSLLLKRLHTVSNVVAAIAIVGCVTFDLGIFAHRYVRLEENFTWTEEQLKIISYLPANAEGRFMQGYHVPLPYNDYMVMGISSIDGYNSGMLSVYTTFIHGVAENPPLDSVVLLSNTELARLDQRAFNFLNVTHYATGEPDEYYHGKLIYSNPDTSFYLYENPNAMPRAFVVQDYQVISDAQSALDILLSPEFDYAKTVLLEESIEFEPGVQSSVASIQIVDYVAPLGEIIIESDTDQESILVLSEPYYTERHAYIDGIEVPLLRANIAFSALVLPEGQHTVVIRYVPEAFQLGARVSIASLMICAGLVVVGAYRKWRR